MRVRAVVQGNDSIWSWSSLESRVGPLISGQGYQVVSLDVSRGFAIVGVPYHADLHLETGAAPSGRDAIVAALNAAFLSATGSFPSEIAIPTFGQTPPDPPGHPLTWLENVAAQLGLSVQVILLALLAGVVFLIYTAARQPKLIASLAR